MWSYFFGPTDDSLNQRILKEELIVAKKIIHCLLVNY